uniref:Uncharacterized protein n=1 Tax=Physcomitrium patens TaxID=3218 RepID=A0A2K1KFW8_PHYPA|nr:hypothetical protein PHYPA_009046 [Physcomitrium patens]
MFDSMIHCNCGNGCRRDRSMMPCGVESVARIRYTLTLKRVDLVLLCYHPSVLFGTPWIGSSFICPPSWILHGIATSRNFLPRRSFVSIVTPARLCFFNSTLVVRCKRRLCSTLSVPPQLNLFEQESEPMC